MKNVIKKVLIVAGLFTTVNHINAKDAIQSVKEGISIADTVLNFSFVKDSTKPRIKKAAAQMQKFIGVLKTSMDLVDRAKTFVNTDLKNANASANRAKAAFRDKSKNQKQRIARALLDTKDMLASMVGGMFGRVVNGRLQAGVLTLFTAMGGQRTAALQAKLTKLVSQFKKIEEVLIVTSMMLDPFAGIITDPKFDEVKQDAMRAPVEISIDLGEEEDEEF